jgi:hypothetical protein
MGQDFSLRSRGRAEAHPYSRTEERSFATLRMTALEECAMGRIFRSRRGKAKRDPSGKNRPQDDTVWFCLKDDTLFGGVPQDEQCA